MNAISWASGKKQPPPHTLEIDSRSEEGMEFVLWEGQLL